MKVTPIESSYCENCGPMRTQKMVAVELPKLHPTDSPYRPANFRLCSRCQKDLAGLLKGAQKS